MAVSSLIDKSIASEKRTWKCRLKTLVFDEMRGEFWYGDISQSAMILDCKVRPKKMPIGRIFGAQTTSRGQRSKSECAALTSSFDRNNNDGKTSLKRQKSPETTMDTPDVSKFY